ncbi:hypothetical protein ABVT39_021459 [Epinephelus coioides]
MLLFQQNEVSSRLPKCQSSSVHSAVHSEGKANIQLWTEVGLSLSLDCQEMCLQQKQGLCGRLNVQQSRLSLPSPAFPLPPPLLASLTDSFTDTPFRNAPIKASKRRSDDSGGQATRSVVLTGMIQSSLKETVSLQPLTVPTIYNAL